MKSIPELTHWHVGLFTFWHFLCTIKHQRYVSQHWLIPEATELPYFHSKYQLQVYLWVSMCVCVCAPLYMCVFTVALLGFTWLTSGKDRGCRAPAHRWKSRKKPGLKMPCFLAQLSSSLSSFSTSLLLWHLSQPLGSDKPVGSYKHLPKCSMLQIQD